MSLTPLEPWIAHKIGRPSLVRAELEAYQLRSLQETLDRARTHSRFYRRHLAGAPAALASLAELERLPFTTAADVRADPLQFLCVSQDDIQRVVTLDTSGTSGPPKRLYFTHDDQALTVDFFRVGMSTFTAPGDRVLILLPGERPGSVGNLLAAALRELGAEPIPHGPVRDVDAALAAAEQADVLVGVPTQALKLARAAPPGRGPIHLHSALLTTDHVPAAVAGAMEQAWGSRVYNHYGMTEMGLGGGVDCAARRGYHLREADLYFEIVDPLTGRHMPENDEGELVFTTLTRVGMPLIRYRTGDLGRWVPGRCPCGTGLKTLAHLTTRRDGRVALGAGATLTMADLDEALFPLTTLLDFTAEVMGQGAQRHLRLVAQARAADDPTLASEIERALLAISAVGRAYAAGSLARPDIQLTAEAPAPGGPAKRAIRVESQLSV